MKTLLIRRLSLLFIFGAAIALAPGCDGDSPAAPTLPEGEVVPVEIYAAQNSGLSMQEQRLVRTQAAFDALLEDIFGDDGVADGVVPPDFNIDMVLAVASGEKPDACYSIEISEASADGTDLTVTVTETEPTADCACAAVLVQPVLVVHVPRADAVRFFVTTSFTCAS
ncbi:MAG: protease complex subunit PrcB family protein [Acidobacteria bacterium]|nr:protease complex subunit PrcB family protein [Acidobacteriota bacterium]